MSNQKILPFQEFLTQAEHRKHNVVELTKKVLKISGPIFKFLQK